jgi:hypothetical protein
VKDYATLLLHQAPQASGRAATTRRANAASHAPVPFTSLSNELQRGLKSSRDSDRDIRDSDEASGGSAAATGGGDAGDGDDGAADASSLTEAELMG